MHNNDNPTTDTGHVEPPVAPAQEGTIAADPGAVPPANAPPATTPEATPVPAPGEPDWFMKDKFKSIDDQAKSYKELSTKMGKYWGSPEESYSIDGMEGVEANDPLIESLMPALKEMGISQGGFKHLVDQYFQANSKMVQGMEAELKKVLTTTDVHTFQQVDKWMNDTMSKEEQDHIKNNWLMSPQDFKMFNNLRLMAAPSTNVPNQTGNAAQFESSKEVENDKITYRKEIRAGTRVADKNHENQLASRFRDAVARELRQKGR